MKKVGKFEVYSREEVLDELIGEAGTPDRESFEREVNDAIHRKNKRSIMETATIRKASNRRRKLTLEERRVINASILPQNRSMKAFKEHQGEVWVKDPMLLL